MIDKLKIITKPGPEEYPPYSAIYMHLLADNGLVLEGLRRRYYEIKDLVYSLPEENLYFRYAEGKWTIKEILVHIIDDERIFSYRALRYARNDQTELPGFDQDDYTRYSGADKRSLDSIFEEYEAVRKSTLALFNGFPDNVWMRSGTSIGQINRRTVRALAYHISGHELRHLNIIREFYLNQPVVNIQ